MKIAMLILLIPGILHAQGFVFCAPRPTDAVIVAMVPASTSATLMSTPPTPATTWTPVTVQSLQPLGTPQDGWSSPDLAKWIANATGGVPLYVLSGGAVVDRDQSAIVAERNAIAAAATEAAAANT